MGWTHNSSLPPNPQGSPFSFSFIRFPLFFAFHPFFLAVRLSFSLATWEQKNLYKMRLTLEQKKVYRSCLECPSFFCFCFIDIDGRILFSGKWEGMRQSEHFPKARNDAIMASLLFFSFSRKKSYANWRGGGRKKTSFSLLKNCTLVTWNVGNARVWPQRRKEEEGERKAFCVDRRVRGGRRETFFSWKLCNLFPRKENCGGFLLPIRQTLARTVVSPQLTPLPSCPLESFSVAGTFF